MGYRYEYHWADGTSVKKPIKCSAPKYIDYLMTWVQDQLDNEAIFPSKIGIKHVYVLTTLYKEYQGNPNTQTNKDIHVQNKNWKIEISIPKILLDAQPAVS